MGSTYKLFRKFIVVALLIPAITLADGPATDDSEWRVVVEDFDSYRLLETAIADALLRREVVFV